MTITRTQVIEMAKAMIAGPRMSEIQEWFTDWQNGVNTREHFIAAVACMQDRGKYTTAERREVAAEVFINPALD